MENYNSNERNRVSNQTLDGSNLNFSNLSNGIEENEIDLNERSNYAKGGIFMSGSSHMVSDLSTHFHGASRTISDFPSGVTISDLIPSESPSNNSRSSLQTQNLWNAATVSFSQSTNFRRPSRTVSDFVDGLTNTSSIPSENLSDNASNFRQMQNLWHAPTASFSHNTQFHGASSMDFVENSTHPTFFEQYTNYHGGSSSASTHQSNAFTQPSGDPVRYLREHGLWDTGRDVYFLRNNIDSQSLSHGGIIMEPGHRDDPIVIEVRILQYLM
ncbi:hypothetical protein MTR67_017590 [Solanum verrucosum]|uniref:Uncharacterized protein n=1 Tax=Solanum verrucosum TaxID=315347 RepID=A0AAF0TSC7_SOLVR|nr:hypothetical protein MTR67_017590 [Solanum verrucosum]